MLPGWHHRIKDISIYLSIYLDTHTQIYYNIQNLFLTLEKNRIFCHYNSRTKLWWTSNWLYARFCIRHFKVTYRSIKFVTMIMWISLYRWSDLLFFQWSCAGSSRIMENIRFDANLWSSCRFSTAAIKAKGIQRHLKKKFSIKPFT